METAAAELTLTPPGPAGLPAVWPLVLIVEYDLNECSPNRSAYAGGPNAARAALAAARALTSRKAKLREVVRRAYDAAGAPEWGIPVTVDATVLRGDACDEDGLRAALKAASDALFKSKTTRYFRRGEKREAIVEVQKSITPDDGRRWVSYGTLTQETDRKWRGYERFILTIYPRSVLDAREAAIAEVLAAADLWHETLDAVGGPSRRLDEAVERLRALGWRPRGGR